MHSTPSCQSEIQLHRFSGAAHQRRRLLAAMREALAEHGYARVTAEGVSKRAGVSIRTFYKHFANLWDCLLAAHEEAAERLCGEIEAACASTSDDSTERLPAGVDAALAFFTVEPPAALLLGGQPPLEAPALSAARRHLVAHLAAMLRRARGTREDAPTPVGLDERLVDATLTFLCARVARGESERLPDLAPELTELLIWGTRPVATRS